MQTITTTSTFIDIFLLQGYLVLGYGSHLVLALLENMHKQKVTPEFMGTKGYSCMQNAIFVTKHTTYT